MLRQPTKIWSNVLAYCVKLTDVHVIFFSFISCDLASYNFYLLQSSIELGVKIGKLEQRSH